MPDAAWIAVCGWLDSGTLLRMTNYPPPPPVEPSAARPEPPQSVLTAVRLMYAGAVLSLLSFITTMVTMGGLREEIERNASAGSGGQLSDTQVDAIVTFTLGLAVIAGLIGAGLWFWMARANLKGRNWARILATVFFGLNTLGVVSTFTQDAGQQAIGLAFSVVIWLVGLGAVIFMWRPDNAPFYQPAPRA